MYLTPPLNGFPEELGIGARGQKAQMMGSEETRMTGLPGGRKSFKIGLAVLIQYRRVTDIHPASQPASQPRCRRRSIYRAYYAARLTRTSADADKPARRV